MFTYERAAHGENQGGNVVEILKTNLNEFLEVLGKKILHETWEKNLERFLVELLNAL